MIEFSLAVALHCKSGNSSTEEKRLVSFPSESQRDAQTCSRDITVSTMGLESLLAISLPNDLVAQLIA